jgi:hypothetical protein
MVIFPIDKIVVSIISVPQGLIQLLFVEKEQLGILLEKIVAGKIQLNAKKDCEDGIK